MRLPLADVVERVVALLGLLADQRGMTLAEGAAAAVLTRQAHRVALGQEAAEGKRLGGGPVKALAAVEHLLLGVQKPPDRLVQGEAVRGCDQRLSDLLEGLGLDRGLAALIFLALAVKMTPAPVQPVGLVGLVAFSGLEFIVQMALEGGLHILDLALGDQPVIDQPVGVDLKSGLLFLDLLVHDRVGEHGLIALVMTEPAVAEDVQHHVLVEFLAELGGDAGGVDHGLGVVAIDVEDRRLDHQRDIGGVGAGAAEMRRGGKADLVVDDDMHGAAGAVAAQTGQAEALGHHALPRKGRVAMQQDAQNRGPVRVVLLILLGAHLAQDDGVHRLKVAGVRGQAQVNRIAIETAVRGRAEVVFHIARAIHVLGLEAAALKLVEDRAVGFGHHVGQHRKTPPVRHPDDDVLDAQGTAALDDLLHRRDQRLAAIEAEALSAHVFHMQEFLEALGLDQLVQDRLAPLAGELDLLVESLDPLLQPAGLLGVRDMHVLQREGAAIGPLHDLQDLPHRGDIEPKHLVDEDGPVHVRVDKAVARRVQLGMRRVGAHAKRVQIGHQMPPDAVGPDQHQRAQAVQNRAAHRLIRDRNALFGRLVGDLLGRRLCLGGRRVGPFPGQGMGQVVSRHRRPVGARPGRARGLGLDLRLAIAERFEELHPGLVHGGGIARVLGVKLLQIFGIVALHEAGGLEGVVGGLVGHGLLPRSRMGNENVGHVGGANRQVSIRASRPASMAVKTGVPSSRSASSRAGTSCPATAMSSVAMLRPMPSRLIASSASISVACGRSGAAKTQDSLRLSPMGGPSWIEAETPSRKKTPVPY